MELSRNVDNSNMIQYNYSDNDAVAHTIGHRTIVVNNTNNTNIQMEAIQNDNLGNNSIDINDYNGHSENGILLYDTASAWNDSGSTITENFGTTVAGVGTTGTNNRTYIGNPLSNSVTQNSNSNERERRPRRSAENLEFVMRNAEFRIGFAYDLLYP